MTVAATRSAFTRAETTRVGEIMHRGLVACGRGSTTQEIAEIMVSHGVHCVAVLVTGPGEPEKPRVWGIVSDLDLVGAAEPDLTAGDLAQAPVISLRPEMTVREASASMHAHGVQHVVVVDPDRHLPLGMLSTLDVARVLAAPGPATTGDVTHDTGH